MAKPLDQLSRAELDELGFGRHGVEDIEHSWFTLPGGERLALRIWAPSGTIQDEVGVRTMNMMVPRNFDLLKRPVTTYLQTGVPILGGEPGPGAGLPCVLEYLPYRKADWTAERDHRRHPWLASHGWGRGPGHYIVTNAALARYVIVRADIRGSGDSDGVYHDEYLAQEQEDCRHLLAWLAARPWSSGKVGMYGKSWGGFNGLQVAFHQPPALAAVISLYSTGAWHGATVLVIIILGVQMTATRMTSTGRAAACWARASSPGPPPCSAGTRARRTRATTPPGDSCGRGGWRRPAAAARQPGSGTTPTTSTGAGAPSGRTTASCRSRSWPSVRSRVIYYKY